MTNFKLQYLLFIAGKRLLLVLFVCVLFCGVVYQERPHCHTRAFRQYQSISNDSRHRYQRVIVNWQLLFINQGCGLDKHWKLIVSGLKWAGFFLERLCWFCFEVKFGQKLILEILE